jgi:hypothetical protein
MEGNLYLGAIELVYPFQIRKLKMQLSLYFLQQIFLIKPIKMLHLL